LVNTRPSSCATATNSWVTARAPASLPNPPFAIRARLVCRTSDSEVVLHQAGRAEFHRALIISTLELHPRRQLVAGNTASCHRRVQVLLAASVPTQS
jgi:hypothetical protein